MNRIIKKMLLILLYVITLSMTLYPTDKEATLKQGVESITLRVDGLSCPFCGYGLEKKLRKLPGFQKKSYKINIKDGEVSFSTKASESINAKLINQKVKDAGFTLKKISLTLNAYITIKGNKASALLMPGLGFQLPLIEKIKDNVLGGVVIEKPDFHLSEKKLEMFKKIQSEKALVQLKGTLHSIKSTEQQVFQLIKIEDRGSSKK